MGTEGTLGTTMLQVQQPQGYTGRRHTGYGPLAAWRGLHLPARCIENITNAAHNHEPALVE